MVRRGRPPSQGWKTFLRNHVAGIASLDLFVVRTISFKLLDGLVILRHARRRLVTISVTTGSRTGAAEEGCVVPSRQLDAPFNLPNRYRSDQA
jgi:hypothetical protein